MELPVPDQLQVQLGKCKTVRDEEYHKSRSKTAQVRLWNNVFVHCLIRSFFNGGLFMNLNDDNHNYDFIFQSNNFSSISIGNQSFKSKVASTSNRKQINYILNTEEIS